MKLKQVGIIALRSPSGEFLPSQPIYEEIEENAENQRAEDETFDEVAKIFAEKMKHYIDGCKKAGLKI